MQFQKIFWRKVSTSSTRFWGPGGQSKSPVFVQNYTPIWGGVSADFIISSNRVEYFFALWSFVRIDFRRFARSVKDFRRATLSSGITNDAIKFSKNVWFWFPSTRVHSNKMCSQSTFCAPQNLQSGLLLWLWGVKKSQPLKTFMKRDIL